MVYIISIDCGVKNFAYSLIEFKTIKLDTVDILFKKDNYKIIDISNKNLYNVKSDNKFNLHDKAVILLLSIVEKLDKEKDIKILVEYQMSINCKANIIYNIILTFFETYYKVNKKTNYEIINIKPCYKIKLAEHVDVDNKIRIKFINQYISGKRF